MRSRLVIWGTNSKEERVLLAVSLLADDNKVEIWSIPEKDTSEEFYNQMMSQWREGSELEIPNSAEYRVTALTMADTILPDDIKVEKSDVIQRAQLEWHFVVLSTKLYKNYKNDFEEIGDKIKRLEEFNQDLWNELKDLWSNVQQHIFDKNLQRDHSDSLKEKSNSLFDELKKLRKAHQSELNQKSKEAFQKYATTLDGIAEKISSGGVLKLLFEELVELQKELKELSFSRSDRESILSKLNECFKSIREKREHRGSRKDSNFSSSDRMNSRYEGLLGAIKRLSDSVEYEKKNIDFENKRIATTDGQLEAQIRVAKIKMIEERLRSKESKLNELLDTKVKLEAQMEKLAKKGEKLKQKQERKEKFEVAKEKIKEEIHETIQKAQEEVPEEVQEKLTKAAEEIKVSKRGSRKKDKSTTETGEGLDPQPKSPKKKSKKQEQTLEKKSEEEE